VSNGEELALAAMKRDLKRLSKAAEKAKAEADEYMNVGSEMLAIHKEFAEIVKSRDHSPATLKKLERLQARSKRTDRIRNKDLCKLTDKQFEAEQKRDALASKVQALEFRLSMRKKLRA
jgi:hypothetical protein